MTDARRNVSLTGLYVDAIRADPKYNIADFGALIAYSGDKTGRAPSDKRIVDDPHSRAYVWLVNTGWSGGSYETGSRMKLRVTRAIVNAIHHGALKDAPTVLDPTFGIAVHKTCPNVDSNILIPRNTWEDDQAYDRTAQKLASLFRNNFQKYIDGTSEEIRRAGPN